MSWNHSTTIILAKIRVHEKSSISSIEIPKFDVKLKK